MATHAEAAEHHHGPPIANQSSRVDPRVLGMFLFIASEVMVFGSFFTAYFFVRVVAGSPWPEPPFHLPVFVAGVNTAILVTSSFTIHWALQSIKKDNRAGLQAGLVLTIALGLVFLLAGISVDDGPSRPYGFWLHVAAGLTIGGGLVWFWNDGAVDWILVGLTGLLYILLGNRLARSSWVVFGAWGVLQTATYFASKWSDVTAALLPFFFTFPLFLAFDEDSFGEHVHNWIGPLIYALTGAFLIAIALWLSHRRRETVAGAELL